MVLVDISPFVLAQHLTLWNFHLHTLIQLLFYYFVFSNKKREEKRKKVKKKKKPSKKKN